MEPHSGFNNLDYIIIGIVLLSALLALMRGFVREIFSLVAWAGAYFIAATFYTIAVPTAHHYIKNDTASEWAAKAAIFLVALIILMVIGHFISSLIKHPAVTTVDRSLGFLYGLARGVLVVALVYLGAVMILWPDIDEPQSIQKQDKDRNAPPDTLVDAKTRPAIAFVADKLKAIVPKEMIDKKIKESEGAIQEGEKAAHQQMLDTLSTPSPPSTQAVPTTSATQQGTKP
jgi:membrane protein required for colicin V production